MTNTIRYDVDVDGIATLTIDVPGQSMNVIGAQFLSDLETLIDRLAADDAVKGAVIASGKDSGFMAGMDLKGMEAMLLGGEGGMAGLFSRVFELNRVLRRLETCGKPVACAIEGTCVGGGFELALACHRRIAGDNPKTQLGLPEVLVGLFPGGGGSQRMPRIAGAQTALMYMLQGKLFPPAEGAALKLIDEVVPAGTAVEAAKAWIRTGPGATQPWDVKGFKAPGGASAMNPNFVQTFIGAVPMTVKQTQHNINAPIALLSSVYEGMQLPMDRAIRIESKYFAKVLADPQARNMVRTLFVNKQAAERGARRPRNIAPSPTKKLAMLGAGMMGAGIATVAAQAGMEVMLLDRDMAAAEKGKAHVEAELQKRMSRGKMTPGKMAEVLARVTPVTDAADLAGCDFVIEAVFEDPAIKADITKRVEAVLGADTIFGSNTSTLPISGLAKAWSKPENFIGIHFFSPVEKMPLVEIILGEKTGPAAIAKALDFVAQIRKTPIVVNDSRGFYTSRCFATYVSEGVQMVAEGVNAALIENVGKQLGMPVGPLAVGDEVSIELGYKITKATKAAMGDAYPATAADDVIEKMVVELGRLGRKNGKGYYEYPEGRDKRLWPGLQDHWPLAVPQPSPAEVRERLLYRQLIECARCYEEGVLTAPEDGDIGAIFGWGFAPYTGGPFSHMDTVGISTVVETLDRLAKAHGPRFAPTKQLREMAAKGENFYPASTKKQAA